MNVPDWNPVRGGLDSLIERIGGVPLAEVLREVLRCGAVATGVVDVEIGRFADANASPSNFTARTGPHCC